MYEKDENIYDNPDENIIKDIEIIMEKTGLDYHTVWSVLWWKYKLFVDYMDKVLGS